MRRSAPFVAAVSLLFVGSLALAQRRVEFRAEHLRLNLVELRQLPDSGVELTVHAQVQAADGGTVTLGGPRTCAPGNLTAAQRTALVTVRNGAIACWTSEEGL